MIHDTYNIHNIRHTMPDLNNACTILTVYNTAQKIQCSKHNSQYIYRQHKTTDEEHNTTQNTCKAECTMGSANTIYKLHNVLAVVQIKCVTCNT